jgi:hypothetical protein
LPEFAAPWDAADDSSAVALILVTEANLKNKPWEEERKTLDAFQTVQSSLEKATGESGKPEARFLSLPPKTDCDEYCNLTGPAAGWRTEVAS